MTGYIALFWGLFVFSLLTLGFSAAGTRHDLVRRRVTGVLRRTKRAEAPDDDLAKPLSERFLKPLLRSAAERFGKFLPKSRNPKGGAGSPQEDKLKKMVRQAGMSIGVGEYSLIRAAVILAAALGAGIAGLVAGLGLRSALAALFGVYAGFAIMRFQLTSRISARRKSMEQQMPDVLDLLSVNVEAGLGFMQALLHVIEHYEGPLIDELTITYREMTMGRTRKEALTLFAERCDLGEIKTFVGSLVQAEQLGISIKNVLRTQAAAMRTSRRNKVEEKAMKTSVKILLPMVAFIFPVLFIVLMGPAVVKIIEQFKG